MLFIPTEFDAGPEAKFPFVLKYGADPEVKDGAEFHEKLFSFPLKSSQELPDPEYEEVLEASIHILSPSDGIGIESSTNKELIDLDLKLRSLYFATIDLMVMAETYSASRSSIRFHKKDASLYRSIKLPCISTHSRPPIDSR